MGFNKSITELYEEVYAARGLILSSDRIASLELIKDMPLLIRGSERKNGVGIGINIYHLSFPAIHTCKPGLKCHAYCYNQYKLKQLYVPEARLRCLYWLQDPDIFLSKLLDEIDAKKIKYLRLLQEGDIPNADFLTVIYCLALSRPNLKITGMTKKYDEFKSELELLNSLENINIRHSIDPDSTCEYYENVDTYRVSWDGVIREDEFFCNLNFGKTCSSCLKCFNKGVKIYSPIRVKKC